MHNICSQNAEEAVAEAEDVKELSLADMLANMTDADTSGTQATEDRFFEYRAAIVARQQQRELHRVERELAAQEAAEAEAAAAAAEAGCSEGAAAAAATAGAEGGLVVGDVAVDEELFAAIAEDQLLDDGDEEAADGEDAGDDNGDDDGAETVGDGDEPICEQQLADRVAATTLIDSASSLISPSASSSSTSTSTTIAKNANR